MLPTLTAVKDWLPAIAGFLAFFGVLFLVIGFALPARRDPLEARLQDYTRGTPITLEEIEMQAPFTERFLRPFTSQFARAFARFTPAAALEGVQRRLILAGASQRWTVSDYVGARGLLMVVGVGFGAAVSVLSGQPTFTFILVLVSFGAIGYFIPGLLLRQATNRRRTEITSVMPDAIDLLTISVEAGLGFDQALLRVVRKSRNALTNEFGRVLYEMQFGVTRRDALHSMQERVGLDDLSSVIAAIIQAEQLGASLANVLRVQATEMRVRRRQHAERLIRLAPVKMLFPIAFLIFPPVFIVVLGPAIPGIVKTFLPNITL
jgi:tight adherence protein C